MSKREQGRVLSVQALYQWDLRGKEFDGLINEFLAESTRDPEVYFFARELTFGAWAFHEQADDWIRKAAAHWEVQRLAAVDRNILRLAIYEMLAREDIPPRVAIDQAIELAKRFGAAESGAFVNGILDRVLREARPDWAPEAAERIEPVEHDGLPVGPRSAPEQAAPKYPDIKDWDEE